MAAGALNFADAISLVEERGKYMQDAVPAGEGGMAAILGLDDDKVREICDNAAQGEVVSAVNYNSPGQVVVAGQATAVDRAIELAKEAGAKRALKLAVSAPSHCALMEPAAQRLAERLGHVDIHTPAIDVINNVDVVASRDPVAIREALVRQLYNPVRWVEIIQKMSAEGVDRLIECGPGKVLVGLNKRIDKGMSAQAVFDPATLDAALSE